MTALLIKLFINEPHNVRSAKVRENYGMLGGFTGVLCNLLLCVAKLTVGIAAGSMSIAADGFNNLSDMGSSVISLIGFRLAGKPADTEHPFGHGRAEYVSAFIVSALVFLLGLELLISSAKALIKKTPAPHYNILPLIILAVSAAVKLWMYFFFRKLGKKIDSKALLATAKDSLGDVLTTCAILSAAAVSLFVKLPFNLDAVMAAAVSVFIIASGIEEAKKTLDEILGGPPDRELVKEIEESILAFDGFLGIHDLIVHDYGAGRQFASVHVEVPQDVDLVKCHEKIDLCEKTTEQKTGVHLVIHIDPIDCNNETVLETRQKVAEILENIDPRLTLHDFRMTPKGDDRTNLIFDVVVPLDCKFTKQELNDLINKAAKEADKTFECVITFDDPFIK